jgi:hypothetical protein
MTILSWLVVTEGLKYEKADNRGYSKIHYGSSFKTLLGEEKKDVQKKRRRSLNSKQ